MDELEIKESANLLLEIEQNRIEMELAWLSAKNLEVSLESIRAARRKTKSNVPNGKPGSMVRR